MDVGAGVTRRLLPWVVFVLVVLVVWAACIALARPDLCTAQRLPTDAVTYSEEPC